MNQSRVGYTGLCTRLRLGEGSKVDLGEAGYLKERLIPQPGDVLYLHLSDLLIALKALIPTHVSMVLDYGCGGSPYRPLFGSCTYHRADLSGGNNLDFEYRSDAKLPSDLSGYDCVLSTQVLEHVEDPQTYLGECYRVLCPGGCLILTTHGLYEDHACLWLLAMDSLWIETARRDVGPESRRGKKADNRATKRDVSGRNGVSSIAVWGGRCLREVAIDRSANRAEARQS